MVRREIAEFRRKQTERQIREQLGTGLTGLASSRELVATARAVRTSAVSQADAGNVASVEAEIHSKLQTETDNESKSEPSDENLKIRTHFEGESPSSSPEAACEAKKSRQRTHSRTPPARNSLCPCHSGRKYKHCCARAAHPVWPKAA
jgi:hypothetical protein